MYCFKRRLISIKWMLLSYILLLCLISIFYIINKNNAYVMVMIVIYTLFLMINQADLFLSNDYLIMNNQIFATKDIVKIKENNFRVYIKLNDNTVYRLWCRNKKIALDIEEKIQVIINRNNYL